MADICSFSLVVRMKNTHKYENLKVWQLGVKIANLVYGLTREFPQSENFGITSQMRSCAVSVPSNIAEGYRRHSKADFRRFLYISLGSLSELETQLIISKNQKYINAAQFEALRKETQKLSKMLYGLIKKL